MNSKPHRKVNRQIVAQLADAKILFFKVKTITNGDFS